MNIDTRKYSAFLEQVANEIDIPAGKYRDAVKRYLSVGHWLEGGEHLARQGKPQIYVQGSFRLGTVVRPIRDGVEACYDIDLVCELSIPKDQTTPQAVKRLIGERLWENGIYRRLLDTEGRRCWTLEYAEEDGIGFHLDVLPAVPENFRLEDAAIAITDKNDDVYSWSASNPRGYGSWFDHKNLAAFQLVALEQKRRIQLQESLIFESIDDVPDQLVRTPLQRSIQLMKRHRDLRFNQHNRHEYAPISIIITTLAAHLYGNESDVYSALRGIVGKLHAHSALVEGAAIDPMLSGMGLIQRRSDGSWYIGNPTNPQENFADRWHEDNHARARAFFAWMDALQKDLFDILGSTNPQQFKEHLGRALGGTAVAATFDVLMADDAPPHIHINKPARPWRKA